MSDLVKSDGYLGRLRGNIKKNQFLIYDTGVQPQDFKPGMGQQIRKHLGTIKQGDKVGEGDKKPRHIDVYIPLVLGDGQAVQTWPDDHKKKNGIHKEYVQQKKSEGQVQVMQSDTSGIQYFLTNDDLKGIDFEGRVTQESVKNFQLIDEDNKVYMQFGKFDANVFNLDVGYPFSLFQAFAIALSSFE